MKFIISLFGILLLGSFTHSNAQSCKTPSKSCAKTCTKAVKASFVESTADASIEVFYFHATRRCATCEAVEKVSREAIAEYYGEKVPFESINREENKDNPLIKKYEISGQTLLIINGGEYVDLTNDAFLYARKNPKKLKAKIKTTIDLMML